MNARELMTRELTKEEAIELAESGWWKDMDKSEVARLQLNQKKLCMDFGAFHEAVEVLLGRSVWTHEFAEPDKLKAEANNEKAAPASPFESLEELRISKNLKFKTVGAIVNGQD